MCKFTFYCVLEVILANFISCNTNEIQSFNIKPKALKLAKQEWFIII